MSFDSPSQVAAVADTVTVLMIYASVFGWYDNNCHTQSWVRDQTKVNHSF